MTAARIIVWRHGRTEWNASGLFQGQADVPLDELGRHQAASVARTLARKKPVAIVASDLIRARETAAPLAERTGLEVSLDKRLREIHVGSWEGLTPEQVAKIDPELAARYRRGEDVRRSPTGETVEEVASRVAEALEEFGGSAPEGSTVIAVMHGLAARVGVCRLVGFPPETWTRLGGLHNCGWISVERHSGGYWRIEEYNVQGAVEPLDPIS
ncbi:histidine phosphatase family protein [Microlunatus panaciterrae]|uniref:Phosphoglycerate mutase n=1 Tax=Microlunatus panaciterrae TaxID=400768 RepID=A0ABS2RLW3_9ACTN|nr:putative phosphoglycerate mutase [Microlunatus panaciterrae]